MKTLLLALASTVLTLVGCADVVVEAPGDDAPAPAEQAPRLRVVVPPSAPAADPCPYRGEVRAAVAPYCYNAASACVWSDTAELFPNARRCDCDDDLPEDGPGAVPPECVGTPPAPVPV